MNKADELVDDFARIIHRQKFAAGKWDKIVIKEPWLEVARDYFKSHPDIVYIDENQEMPSIYNGRGEMKTALKYKREIQDFKRIGRFE